MPYLKIQTNIKSKDKEKLMEKASARIAKILNKEQSYVMIHFEESSDMFFAQSPEPCLYLELKSLSLDETKTEEYSKSLCSFFSDELNISPNRIYIEFAHGERHMWGWNKKTFAQ
ncbi:MAG: phenylpyruvate tautomerase MIF-related protein [Bacteroidales bacterium]